MNERKLKRGAYSKKLMGHKLWICNYSHISILNFDINWENSVKCSQKKKTFNGIGPKVKGMLYKLLGKYEQEGSDCNNVCDTKLSQVKQARLFLTVCKR